MKTRAALCLVLVAASNALAADGLAEFDMLAPAEMSRQWKSNPALWRDLTATRTNPVVSVGGSEFRVSGPVVDAFRRSAGRANRPGLGKQLLAFPLALVGLVMPQPMPRPPEERGRYFDWTRPSALPWADVGAGAAVGIGKSADATDHEAAGGLLSIGR